MRLATWNIRELPWLLALLGLMVPLVAGGLVLWPLVAAWLLILVLLRVLGGTVLPKDRRVRIGLAIAALPLLVLLAFAAGWCLIPADVAWLVIEVVRPAG